jgi:hypothetical protein
MQLNHAAGADTVGRLAVSEPPLHHPASPDGPRRRVRVKSVLRSPSAPAVTMWRALHRQGQ